MTSVQVEGNDMTIDIKSSDPNESRTSDVLCAPPYALSNDTRSPDVFNKENMDDEIAAKRARIDYNLEGLPILKAVAMLSAPQDKIASSSLPMPPPPMMRFSSSAAFSDISLPFSTLASSQSFDRSGGQVHHPQMTEFLQYASASGQALYGISPSNLYTPMQDEVFSLARPPVEHDFQRRNAEWHAHNDLTMAASALLDLTPAMINKNMESGPVPTKKLTKTPSQRDLSITAEIDDWSRQWVETSHLPVPAKYKNSKLQIVLRAQELLQEDIPFTLHACRCKNSHCLKLYCNCFQSGAVCDPLICICRSCENSAEHSVPRGSRTRAIYEILNRRLNAFEPKPAKKMGQGCSCKKNRCLQKYCNCFSNNTACTKKCWCYECSNGSMRDNGNASTNFPFSKPNAL